MAQSRSRSASAVREPQRHVDRRLVSVIVAAVLAIALAGAAGYWLRGATTARHEVRVSRAFAGTVTVVSADGAAGCVKPDRGGGRPACAGFAILGGQPVHAGDKVHAALEWAYPAGGNGGYDLVLIYPQAPPS